MGAKAKVACGLVLFFIVFGLRFFCANCQRFPPQPHQIQLQAFPQHIPIQQQMQAVAYPMQKDLFSNENRLQSQIRLCSRGRLLYPCPKTTTRKPIIIMLPVPIPVHSAVQTTTGIPQVVLRSTVSFGPQDTSASEGGQKEYYTNWSHLDNSVSEPQQIDQSQRTPTKNCKRKRRPQQQSSTTQSPPYVPPQQQQQQYWRGHVEDEQPRLRPRQPLPEVAPTQISERVRDRSTTKLSERIGEAIPSGSTTTIQEPSSTQHTERSRNSFSLEYPTPTHFSEKIREYNPTKDTIIARQPITSTVYDTIQDPTPTKISERNRETFSSDPIEHEVPKPSPTTFREYHSRRTTARNQESLTTRTTRIREPLAALEKEQKLSELRNKQRQEFVAEVTAGYRDKSYRRPYSQARRESTQASSKEEHENKSPKSRSPIDLKKILKNSGGLSLSEILQQKNLSLDDLLKGKQTALLALQTTAAAPKKQEEVSSKERFSKPIRRIPPPSISSTTISTTTTTTSTTVEPIATDLSLEESSLHSEESPENIEDVKVIKDVTAIRKNIRFPSRIRMSPTTKRQQYFETTLQQRYSTTTSTTPKPSTTRIPLYKKRQPIRSSLIRTPSLKKTPDSGSSESKVYQELLDSEETTFTTSHSKRSRFRTTSTTTTEPPIPDHTDPESNFVEDSGENEVLIPSSSMENTSFVNETKQNAASVEQDESTTDHIYRYNSLKNYIDNNLPHAVFMDIDLADIDPVDDRSDLLELIEDRRSGNRLIKVLEQRNMTLDELIEHRKRGSSQLHLTTFVQNKSGVFPGKKVVVNDDMDIVTAFENFPHFNLLNLKSVKPDDIKTDSQGSSYFTSITDIEPTDEVFKDDSGSETSTRRKNSIRNPSNSNKQRQPFYPSWKSLALASLTTGENARRFLQRSDPDPPQQTAQRHQSTVIEEDPILQIEDEVARAHDLIDLELSGHGFKRSALNLMHTSQMPPGIRSAIVASAAIVLTSLITFMVIFVACRWKQRRRRCKLDYLEAYNAMKSKLPTITHRKADELTTSTTSLGLECVAPRLSRSNSRQSQHHISTVYTGGYPSASTLSPSCSKSSTVEPNAQDFKESLFDALRDSF